MNTKKFTSRPAPLHVGRRTLDAAQYLQLAADVVAECSTFEEVYAWARRKRKAPHSAQAAWHLSQLTDSLQVLLAAENSPLSVSTAALIGAFPPDLQEHIYKLLIGKMPLPKGTHRLTRDALMRMMRDKKPSVRDRFRAYKYPWPDYLDADGRRIPGS